MSRQSPGHLHGRRAAQPTTTAQLQSDTGSCSGSRRSLASGENVSTASASGGACGSGSDSKLRQHQQQQQQPGIPGDRHPGENINADGKISATFADYANSHDELPSVSVHRDHVNSQDELPAVSVHRDFCEGLEEDEQEVGRVQSEAAPSFHGGPRSAATPDAIGGGLATPDAVPSFHGGPRSAATSGAISVALSLGGTPLISGTPTFSGGPRSAVTPDAIGGALAMPDDAPSFRGYAPAYALTPPLGAMTLQAEEEVEGATAPSADACALHASPLAATGQIDEPPTLGSGRASEGSESDLLLTVHHSVAETPHDTWNSEGSLLLQEVLTCSQSIDGHTPSLGPLAEADQDDGAASVSVSEASAARRLDLQGWERDRKDQESRLEAYCQASAQRGSRWVHAVNDGQEAFRSSEGSSLARALTREKEQLARLECGYAAQVRYRDATDMRAQHGVLDGAAIEARADEAWIQRRMEQQRRLEEQFASLQRRQVATEEEGRQRWLKTSVLNIGAARFPSVPKLGAA